MNENRQKPTLVEEKQKGIPCRPVQLSLEAAQARRRLMLQHLYTNEIKANYEN